MIVIPYWVLIIIGVVILLLSLYQCYKTTPETPSYMVAITLAMSVVGTVLIIRGIFPYLQYIDFSSIQFIP
jgi:uncharacterized membrane protein